MGTTLPTPPPGHRYRPRHCRARRPLSAPREIAALATAMIVYFGGRVLVEGSEDRATRNAERLLDLEASIGIDVERSLQDVALDSDVVRILGNLSYVWLHWPLLIAALVLLFLRDPPHYRQFRNALYVSGSIGLVLFAVVPMAPPRFMPGFVGTVSDDARRHYIGYPLGWANKFAAFPSFHVGWTLIACLAVAATLDRRMARYLALIPALLVGASVVTTGNHYLLDSVAGGTIAVAAYSAFGWAYRPRHLRVGSSPVPEPPPDTGEDPTSSAAGREPFDQTVVGVREVAS